MNDLPDFIARHVLWLLLVVSCLWLLLTAASSLLVAAADHALGLQYAWLAKPLVEGGLACVSFVLMRYVVYR